MNFPSPAFILAASFLRVHPSPRISPIPSPFQRQHFSFHLQAITCTFRSPCPILYVVFCSNDIRYHFSKSSKKRNVKFFGPKFWGGTTLTFLWQIVSAIYCPPFGKVWLGCVCETCQYEVECRIYEQWAKMTVQF